MSDINEQIKNLNAYKWLPIEPIPDLDVDASIEMSVAELCLAFNVPRVFIDGRAYHDGLTEDAEFEIIEPKQLPMPIDLSDANEQIKNINDVVGRNLQCIAEHTVDLSLINRDSKVLDLGCRAFSWTNYMLGYVSKIVCVDADPDIEVPNIPVLFIRGAVHKNDDEVLSYRMSGNGTGNCLMPESLVPDDRKSRYLKVKTVSLRTISEISYVLFWDLIKFDIEGSEVPVLLSLTKPPARQITCEFHMHTGTTRDQVHRVFDHMGCLGYERVFQDFSRKHGLGENYWDVLFVLRDEIK